jgi:subtilisin-like proprotein convertase family protein
MWRAWGSIVLAGCSFAPAPINGTVDAPPMFDDGGHELRQWIFDTGTDFTTPGYAARDLTVDFAHGAITPAGYLTGGLVLHGYDPSGLWLITDPDNTISYDQAKALTPSGPAALWYGVDLPAVALGYLGIADENAFTLWMEGEVFLLHGANQWSVDSDGVGFVEVAPVGSTAFQRVAISKNSGAQTGTFDAPADAWYPIRIAFDNTTGPYHLFVRHADPGGSLGVLTRDRLRARGSEIGGTLRSVYYRQIFGGGQNGNLPVPQLIETDLLAQTDFNPAPPGTGNGIDWSARYSGQLYVTVPGTYTFAAAADDGVALRAGNAPPMSQRWTRDSQGTAAVSVPTDLVAGWNDILLDYNQVASTMSLSLVVNGPDPALTGVPIPRDRLRAVEPRVDRLVPGSVVNAGVDIPNNGVGGNNYGELAVTLAGAVTETVTSVDVTVKLTTQHTDQLVFRLRAPDGTETPLATHPGSGAATNALFMYTTKALAGTALSGMWTVRVGDDTGGGNISTLYEAHVTAHTDNGPAQVAQLATWISPVIDHATRLYQIDDMHWDERAGGAMPAAIFIRTCDLADCSDGAWSGPFAQHAMPTLDQKRYMQAMVQLSSDGAHDSELSYLEVDYRRYIN